MRVAVRAGPSILPSRLRIDAADRAPAAVIGGGSFPLSRSAACIMRSNAPVAQLDRAVASGATGREFESLRAHHFSSSCSHPPHSPDMNYDAILIVSFGGPEKRDDVIPFLENVLRGRNVPRERMLEVAEHYYHFEGKSPINDHNRALIAALDRELQAHGPRLPIYWGNRNWHPLLGDTLRRMREDGVGRVLAFATSAFGSYSGCRQYLENIERARESCAPDGLEIHKLRTFH